MKPKETPESTQLRQRAEAFLDERSSSERRRNDIETQRLVHELQIHQLELELQNEELLNSRRQVEAALARYSNLYEYSPVGYFTLRRSGVVVQTNRLGASLLEIERDRLPNKYFGAFVIEADLPAFITFLQQVFATRQHQSCEVGLLRLGLPPRIVQIEGTPSPDGEECHAVVVDVTAFKHAALLKQTQQVARIGGWQVLLATGNCAWTEEVFQIFEVPPDYDPDNFERNLALFAAPEQELIRKAFHHAAEKGTPFNLELKLIGAQGTAKWIAFSGQAEGDERGVQRIFGNIVDITERQLARLALLDSELFVKATIDAVSAHICVLDRHGTILAVNQAWRTFCDRNHPAPAHLAYCVGSNYLSVCDAASADDNNALSMADGIRKVIAGELNDFTIHYPCHSDREQRWFIARVTRFHGDSGNVVVAHENITEHKRLEEKLQLRDQYQRTVLDNIPCLVWLKDEQSRFLAVNTPFATAFGYASPNMLNGKDDFAIVPRELAAAYRADDLWVIENGKSKRIEEVIETGGTRRWFETHKSPVSLNGRVIGTAGFARDITEQKKADSSLQLAKADAERANNAKSRFLAAASHDLRQPLSALGLYVDVLKNKSSPADRHVLGNMASCVSSLNELLTDLLDMSKLDAGVVRPEIVDFSVAELLANLISVHSPEAMLKGLGLRWLASELSARTDPVLYKRLLGNLIANAIRYTEKGGVLVACRRQLGKSWIEVWDTGIGIESDKINEIFEEFRQIGHDERNRGSGLGLAIVAKSAALLGLQIRVHSQPGRGSMFAVELPLGKARKRAASRKTKIKPLNIGLVEDNVGVLNALVCALEVVGHRVVAAANCQELLQLLGDHGPDIIISDYRLAEGQTGFDVIATVRKTFGANLPALLITGDTDPKLMRSMADRGILVQHKPVDIDSLQLCIGQATSWR